MPSPSISWVRGTAFIPVWPHGVAMRGETERRRPLTVSGEAGGKEMKGKTEHVSACAAP